MSPDNSRKALRRHAYTLAMSVLNETLNASAVTGLLTSVAEEWCDPTCRFKQLENAILYYEDMVGDIMLGKGNEV